MDGDTFVVQLSDGDHPALVFNSAGELVDSIYPFVSIKQDEAVIIESAQQFIRERKAWGGNQLLT